MCQIMKRILCSAFLCFVLLGICGITVWAQEEVGTAGSSLGKKTEEYQDVQTYSRARAVEGWIYNESNGKWWYQYSDESWPATSWRRINGSWYYFDSDGYWVDNNTYEAGSIKGIDVSQWQGSIDWQAVKNDGIQFAFVRVGHGTHTLDTYYQQNMANANAVGIQVGVYFYSTARTEAQAVEDAQFVIQSMKGYLVSYPVVIDLEDASQTNLSRQQITKIARAYCDEIRAAGYMPMVYCNENWYRNMIDASQLTDVEMWVARWGNTYSADIPRDIWQCCSTGRVAGINANVDIDFGYTDYSQIVTPRTEPQAGYVMSGGIWVKDSVGWWYQYFKGGYPANTWENIRGVWYWFDANGYMATGWRFVDGHWYYMNGSGAMTTGWQLIGSTWYYLDGSGAMHTGWQDIGGSRYYLDSSGAMRTGWLLLDGTWYYLNGSGAMTTGWQFVGNTWYYLDADGKMLTGLQEINGLNYYLDSSGAMKTGWVWSGNDCYYFTSSGAMAADTWIGDYYVDESGVWVQNMVRPGWILSGGRWWYRHLDGGYTTSGWEDIGGARHYFDEAGWMVTGWRLVDGTWYYLDGGGAMHVGWLLLGNTWYYLDTDGKMLTGMQEISGRRYYLDGSGAMKTGWVLLDNTWYYYDGSGAMYHGWLWYGNAWYYLIEDGAMAVGSHQIDGTAYEFASDGRMI